MKKKVLIGGAVVLLILAGWVLFSEENSIETETPETQAPGW